MTISDRPEKSTILVLLTILVAIIIGGIEVIWLRSSKTTLVEAGDRLRQLESRRADLDQLKKVDEKLERIDLPSSGLAYADTEANAKALCQAAIAKALNDSHQQLIQVTPSPLETVGGLSSFKFSVKYRGDADESVAAVHRLESATPSFSVEALSMMVVGGSPGQKGVEAPATLTADTDLTVRAYALLNPKSASR